MVTLKTIRQFKCPIALFGTMIFSIVVGCSVLCDLALIPFSSSPSFFSASHHQDAHSAHNASHQGKHQDDHGGHDHNSHGHGDHGHAATNDHNDQSSNEGGCCEDLTQRFYSSLTESPTGTMQMNHVQAFNVLATLFLERAPVALKPVEPIHIEFQHLANGPPGSNGQRLRILFSSFQI